MLAHPMTNSYHCMFSSSGSTPTRSPPFNQGCFGRRRATSDSLVQACSSHNGIAPRTASPFFQVKSFTVRLRAEGARVSMGPQGLRAQEASSMQGLRSFRSLASKTWSTDEGNFPFLRRSQVKLRAALDKSPGHPRPELSRISPRFASAAFGAPGPSQAQGLAACACNLRPQTDRPD